MHKYGPDAQIKFKGNRLWTWSCQQGPHNHILSSSHVVSTCSALSVGLQWVPTFKAGFVPMGFFLALFSAMCLSIELKNIF